MLNRNRPSDSYWTTPQSFMTPSRACMKWLARLCGREMMVRDLEVTPRRALLVRAPILFLGTAILLSSLPKNLPVMEKAATDAAQEIWVKLSEVGNVNSPRNSNELCEAALARANAAAAAERSPTHPFPRVHLGSCRL